MSPSNESFPNGIFVAFLIIALRFQCTKAAIEEIEATPTNTNAVELGDLSMPQFLVFCILFLLIVTLYGIGVVPIEVDLGYFYGTGSATLFPQKLTKREVNYNRMFIDCPMQYVCEVDRWANRDDHELFVEKLVATWFKNPDSKFISPKYEAFGGVGSCSEMYPCPTGIQDLLGLGMTAPKNSTVLSVEDNDADVLMDLTT